MRRSIDRVITQIEEDRSRVTRDLASNLPLRQGHARELAEGLHTCAEQLAQAGKHFEDMYERVDREVVSLLAVALFGEDDDKDRAGSSIELVHQAGSIIESLRSLLVVDAEPNGDIWYFLKDLVPSYPDVCSDLGWCRVVAQDPDGLRFTFEERRTGGLVMHRVAFDDFVKGLSRMVTDKMRGVLKIDLTPGVFLGDTDRRRLAEEAIRWDATTLDTLLQYTIFQEIRYS